MNTMCDMFCDLAPDVAKNQSLTSLYNLKLKIQERGHEQTIELRRDLEMIEALQKAADAKVDAVILEMQTSATKALQAWWDYDGFFLTGSSNEKLDACF